MSQTTETTNETTNTVPVKAAAKKTAPAKKVAAKASAKTTTSSSAKKPAGKPTKAAAKKPATKTPAVKKVPSERGSRPSKYRDDIIKFLAKCPDGATDSQISDKLVAANSLRRVMINDKDVLFKWEQIEGVKGLTFSLTAAGKALAKKL